MVASDTVKLVQASCRGVTILSGKRLRPIADGTRREAASSNFEQVKLYTNKLLVENVQLYIRLGYSVDREGAVVSGIKGHVIARSVATKQSISALQTTGLLRFARNDGNTEYGAS